MKKQCVDGCDRSKSCRSNHVTTRAASANYDKIKSFHRSSQRGRTVHREFINFQCPVFNTRYNSIGHCYIIMLQLHCYVSVHNHQITITKIKSSATFTKPKRQTLNHALHSLTLAFSLRQYY